MEAIFSSLMIQTTGGGIYIATLTDNYTVSTAFDSMSAQFLQLTPSGADRQVILPDPAQGLVGCFFLIGNDAASGGYDLLVRGKTLTAGGTLSSASTIGTIDPGMMALSVCYWDGTYWRWSYKTFAPSADLTLSGILALAASISGSTAAASITANVTGASASPDGLVVAVTQTTNNRSGGTATGVDITVTGRAGDAGGTYEAIRGTSNKNGGSSTTVFAKIVAGFTRLLDLSETATGEGNVMLADNLADAFSIRQASTYLMKVVTTTGAKIVQFAQGIGADTISEVTSAAGVTVDGCLIKDGRAAALATAAMFTSTEQTGTGSSQNVAHGFGAAPSMWWAVPTDTTAGWVVSAGSSDATNVAITVTSGAKFRVYAIK